MRTASTSLFMGHVALWLLLLGCILYLSHVSNKHGRLEELAARQVSDSSLKFQDHRLRTTSVDTAYSLPYGFEFDGSWPNDNGNNKNMVMESFVSAMILIQTTLDVLSGAISDGQSSGANDPSFKRYWNDADFLHFQVILGRLQAVLGAPGEYAALRQCMPSFHPMKLLYGDAPKENFSGLKDNCRTTDTIAYYGWYANPATQEIGAYIAFCPLFFYTFKVPLKLESNPSIPYVNERWIGNAIDGTDMARTSEASSGASFLIHELLHWPMIFIGHLTENEQILDLVLTRPDNQGSRIAYRAFYAMKVKDPAWRAKSDTGQSFQIPQRYNVDTYVYTILEIFYRIKFNRQPWQDPPDPVVGT